MFSSPCHSYVYFTWPGLANARNVIFWVMRGGAPVSRKGIQNGTGFRTASTANLWVYLGEYDFVGGPDEYVGMRLKDPDTQPNDTAQPGWVVADAVRFTSKPLSPTDGAVMLAGDQASVMRTVVQGKAGPTPIPAGLAALIGNLPQGAGAAPGAAGNAQAPIHLPGPNQGTQQSHASSQSEGPLWQTDVRTALALAGESHKRILLYWYSGDASRCQAYNKMLREDARLLKLITEKYIPAALNMDSNSDTAARLGVYRAGTFFVYESTGAAVKKIDSELDVAALTAELSY